jgi:hypothetical protein
MIRRTDAPVIGVLAAAALALSWKLSPLRGFATTGVELVFWIATGLLAGAVAGGDLMALRRRLSPRSAAAGAVVGFAVAAFAQRPIALAAGLLALAALIGQVSARVSSVLPGLALGAVGGAFAGRTACLALAGISVVGVVLLTRQAAVPVTVAVLLLMALASWVPAAPPAAAADRRTVKVPAGKDFVGSGITVTAGQVVHVKAAGTVTFLKGATADPNGYPARYSGCGGPGFCAVLVGRIGKDGASFLLGSEGIVAAPAAGELQLGVNDYDLSDNSGSFSAEVWLTAEGTAPTVALRPHGVVPVPGSSTASLSRSLVVALCVALGAAVGLGASRRVRAAREAEAVPIG